MKSQIYSIRHSCITTTDPAIQAPKFRQGEKEIGQITRLFLVLD